MVHDIYFTVELKNSSFTHRLSGHFLNRCGINSMGQGSSRKLRIQEIVEVSALNFSVQYIVIRPRTLSTEKPATNGRTVPL